ncbi:hypothetical protein CBL_11339 [Carabus blaptoides fortunei]
MLVLYEEEYQEVEVVPDSQEVYGRSAGTRCAGRNGRKQYRKWRFLWPRRDIIPPPNGGCCSRPLEDDGEPTGRLAVALGGETQPPYPKLSDNIQSLLISLRSSSNNISTRSYITHEAAIAIRHSGCINAAHYRVECSVCAAPLAANIDLSAHDAHCIPVMEHHTNTRIIIITVRAPPTNVTKY